MPLVLRIALGLFLLIGFLVEAKAQEAPAPVRMAIPGCDVEELRVRLTNVNNVRYAPDGRLFALGYDGRIHVLTDRDGDGIEDRAEVWWDRPDSDLRNPVGFVLAEDGVYVTSQGKVSFLSDTDGDGRGDHVETVTTGWPEVKVGVDAVGLARDEEGNLYFGLITADYTNPYLVDRQGQAHYDLKSERGTILKVSRDRKRREIVCTGIRVPVGLAFNRAGDLFCTDQEGATWLPGGNALDELLHIVQGRHYGFPPRHSVHLPGVVDEPAVATFGPQHQSTCGLVFNEARTGWKSFGPPEWEGDAIVTGESRGKIWRVPLVKTSAGYVGRPILIASLSLLTVDATISPAGDLVVACHSGLPDWGTGPKGDGRIFKIRTPGDSVASPAAVWAESPIEVRVALNRSPPGERAWAVPIEAGEFVSAADAQETLSPPYKAVAEQKRAPRTRLVAEWPEIIADGRMLVIKTPLHPWRCRYALSVGFWKAWALGSIYRGAMPIDYTLEGVEAFILPAEGSEPHWKGWLPHLDPKIVAGLTRGSITHERFADRIRGPGRIEMNAKIALPRPGALRLVSNRKFELLLDDQPTSSQEVAAGEHRAEIPIVGAEDPPHLRVRAALDSNRVSWTLDVACAYPGDPHPRPLPLESLILPWAPDRRAPRTPPEEAPSSETLTGDAARGREFFVGDGKCARCHSVRGEGAAFAPDLSNLVHWNPARIRREILDPSSSINPEYTSCLVELKSGEILTGVVLTDGPERLKIVDADAKATIVARADLKDLRAGKASIMPEGLVQKDDPRLDDLVAFLAGAGTPAILRPLIPSTRTRIEVDAAMDPPTAPPADPRAIRITLVTGPKDHGPGEHDYPAFAGRWSELLGSSPAIHVSRDYQRPSQETWDRSDVIVLFFMDFDFWSEETLRHLDAFQARGGGLVLLHSAVVAGPNASDVARRIGLCGKMPGMKYRHGPLDLARSPIAYEITRGLPAFAIRDESYWPLEGDASKAAVLLTSAEEGEARPMVWTFEARKGRVFASILGHYAATFDDPFARLLVLRGLCWSARESLRRLDALAIEGLSFEPR